MEITESLSRVIAVTVSSDTTPLRHNSVVYESDDDYLARAVPFLRRLR
jgi:hypothetical protein